MANKDDIEMTETQKFVKAVSGHNKHAALRSLERILKEKTRKRVNDVLNN